VNASFSLIDGSKLWKNSFRAFTIGGVLIFGGCLKSTSADTVTVEATISGKIDAAFLARLEAEVAAGAKRIVVKSGGGDGLVGVKLARIVVENDLTIIVDDYCISACASYVFLPAKSREVLPNSVVGFHHDNFSFGKFVEEHEGTIPERLMLQRQEMVSLFKLKPDLKWMEFSESALRKLKPQFVTEGKCPPAVEDVEKSSCLQIGTLFQLWIPSRDDYEKYQIKAEFHQPIADAEYISRRVFCGPEFQGMPFLYGGVPFFGSPACKKP